jgi:hypothetical protein
MVLVENQKWTENNPWTRPKFQYKGYISDRTIINRYHSFGFFVILFSFDSFVFNHVLLFPVIAAFIILEMCEAILTKRDAPARERR